MTCRWCNQPITQKPDGTWKHDKWQGIGSYHTPEAPRAIQRATIHGEVVEYSHGAIMGFEMMPFPKNEGL